MTKKTTGAKPALKKTDGMKATPPARGKPATKSAIVMKSAVVDTAIAKWKSGQPTATGRAADLEAARRELKTAPTDAKRMTDRARELEAASRVPKDVAGPAGVRLPDGGVKMVDKDIDDAVQAKAGERTVDINVAAPRLALAKPEQPQQAEKVKAEKLGDIETVQIEARIFAAALHCAAKNDVRYYLNGVHLFEHREGVLRVEATNGHVLFVHDYPVEKVPAWAKGRGVIIDRAHLGKAIAAAGKDDACVVNLSSGLRHTHVTVGTWPDQWAQFRLATMDGKFPDTEKIAEGAASTLSHEGERIPMATTAIGAEYFKLATLVAQSLDIPGVQAYMGDGASAAVFAFGIRRAALYVMPIREGGTLTAQAASILAPAVTRSLGALKAHQTRNELAAKNEKDPELAKELSEKAKQFARRIKELMGAANDAKALPAPEKKAA